MKLSTEIPLNPPKCPLGGLGGIEAISPLIPLLPFRGGGKGGIDSAQNRCKVATYTERQKMTDLERIFLEKLVENDSVDVFDFVGTGIDESNINQIANNIGTMLGEEVIVNHIGVN